jgi:tRNA(fMet)-specific endonuclease VapC
MKHYMLDTNMVSHSLRGHPIVLQRLEAIPMRYMSVSVITEGELLFGLAKRPEATRLRELVDAFLCRVTQTKGQSFSAS